MPVAWLRAGAPFFAQPLTREQHSAKLGHKRRVSRCVIAVDVRVDEETDGTWIDVLDRGENLVANLQVLGIDHEDPVGPGEHADSSASASGVRGPRFPKPRSMYRFGAILSVLISILSVPESPPGPRRSPTWRRNDRSEEQLFGLIY